VIPNNTKTAPRFMPPPDILVFTIGIPLSKLLANRGVQQSSRVMTRKQRREMMMALAAETELNVIAVIRRCRHSTERQCNKKGTKSP
jgi:hypothetical protein